jgi:hypothetical protein
MYKSADWWVRVQTANSWQFTIPLPHKKSKADAMVNSDFVNPYGSTMVYTDSGEDFGPAPGESSGESP